MTESVTKIQEQAKEDQIELLSKKRQRESQKRLSSPTKSRCQRESIPPLPDSIEKIVEHLYEDEGTGAEDWYAGPVVTVKHTSDMRMKDPLRIVNEIQYDDGDQAEINLVIR